MHKIPKKSSTDTPLLKTNNGTVTDNLDKAELLNTQFQSVFTNEDFTVFPVKGPSPHPSVSNIIITSDGVAKLLSGLDIFKAPGPDNIRPWVLRELYDVIAPILAIIFNTSLQNHVVPQGWKLANITPIFKKGDRAQPCNYRPIYLTNLYHF